MADLNEMRSLYDRMKAVHATRDKNMREVLAVREGRTAQIFPDLFPDAGDFADRSLAANMVDVAARDTAEVLAPLPTVVCNSGTNASDKAQKFADKRTKIANNYLTHSQAQRQMYSAADHFVTYGVSYAMVDIDWDNQQPFITFLDPMGSYVIKDRFNRVTAFFQGMMHDVDTLKAMYPALANHIKSVCSGIQQVEVVRYHDKDQDVLFLHRGGGLVLQTMKNPIGVPLVVDTARPGVTKESRGQFDDVLAIQVAKHRFALLALEATTKAVQAPIALPTDVQELAIGSDATLRSQTPDKIRRIGLDVPRETFIEQQSLDSELRNGARYPEVRSGQMDSAIITGAGARSMQGGFDTQIRTGQAMFALTYQRLVELCFLVDETLWPTAKKTIRGNQNGTPFEIDYQPSKDISGDYTVDVQYGLMAGLDPNRALVFGLQARGDKLISRDFLRSQMPFSLDPSEEEQKVDIEDLRDALKQAFAGYAQAIPALASQGQDPGLILKRMSDVIQGRQRGGAIEVLIAEAFTPEAPPPGVEPTDAGAPPTGAPDQAPPGGGGMPPDQQGQMPRPPDDGSRPDVQNLLAGLTGGGQPSLQANVQKRLPA